MGLAGFEPTIPSARGWYPTKLDHNPPFSSLLFFYKLSILTRVNNKDNILILMICFYELNNGEIKKNIYIYIYIFLIVPIMLHQNLILE
jgi:hypothetical protein